MIFAVRYPHHRVGERLCLIVILELVFLGDFFAVALPAGQALQQRRNLRIGQGGDAAFAGRAFLADEFFNDGGHDGFLT